MSSTYSHTSRIKQLDSKAATSGTVKWSPLKSIWLLTCTTLGLIGVIFYFSFEALFVFLITTVITLCAGHSVGMHRLLIHKSFKSPKLLEYILVYLGTLVGMAGPLGMIKQHDLRDWAQAQLQCHPYLRHNTDLLQDYFWQCHCDLHLNEQPKIKIEETLLKDKYYQFLERYWILHQLPWAIILYALGGVSFVLWGVFLRVAVSVTGHWLVGHFAHNDYEHSDKNITWWKKQAAVQGKNVPFTGLISMGESWHNNHHAFPYSAKIGIEKNQPDPGWWLILALKFLGLAWDIKTPAHKIPENLRYIQKINSGCHILHHIQRLRL